MRGESAPGTYMSGHHQSDVQTNCVGELHRSIRENRIANVGRNRIKHERTLCGMLDDPPERVREILLLCKNNAEWRRCRCKVGQFRNGVRFSLGRHLATTELDCWPVMPWVQAMRWLQRRRKRLSREGARIRSQAKKVSLCPSKKIPDWSHPSCPPWYVACTGLRFHCCSRPQGAPGAL